MNHGFLKVSAAVPNLKVADCIYNSKKILKGTIEAYENNTSIIVFPELSITAYTCADLFQQEILINGALDGLKYLSKNTQNIDIVLIVGAPIRKGVSLYNCAVVLHKGKILGIIPKSYIPNYKEYYELRWFKKGLMETGSINLFEKEVPFGSDLIFRDSNNKKIAFGVEICEDLWVPIPPSSYMAKDGATLIFNLSASNEIIAKYEYRKSLVEQQSARCVCGYIYSSAGVDESTTDIVFAGHSMIAENGLILQETDKFQRNGLIISGEIDIEKLVNERNKLNTFDGNFDKRNYRYIDYKMTYKELNCLNRFITATPFVPLSERKRDERCNEIFNIQKTALAKRIKHTRIDKVIIGISGGLDSTLALLVVVKTFDLLRISRKKIIAITMPGFGTSDETYCNALELMDRLKVTKKEISIKNACSVHFNDIEHDIEDIDLTYENVQARERTQILMDLATKENGMVVGTGDLSEMALGWCTYNGDHMSMYSVNCSVPKTLVKYLVRWVSENVMDKLAGKVLKRILNTPISPELLPTDNSGEISQKTEDIIGPYELHDFYLYHFIRYGAKPEKILFLAKIAFEGKYKEEVIKKYLKVFLKRFFNQQFKRSCQPDGPKVGTISLSPRGDWRMASDSEVSMWLKNL